MENTQFKPRDLSLVFMVGVILMMLALSGCDTTGQMESDTLDSTAVTTNESTEMGEEMMDDQEEAQMMESHDDSMEAEGEMMDSSMDDLDESYIEEQVESSDEPEMEEVSVEETVEPAVANYQSGTLQAYDQVLFEEAIANGEKVFVDVYAPWCPTCRGNEEALQSAISSSGVVAFRVDYDTNQAFKSAHGVTTQSTYLIFEGASDEKSRIVGAQTTDSFLALIQG